MDNNALFDLPAGGDRAGEGDSSPTRRTINHVRWATYKGRHRTCDRCVQGRHDAEATGRRVGGQVLPPMAAVNRATMTRRAPGSPPQHYCHDHGKLAEALDVQAARTATR